MIKKTVGLLAIASLVMTVSCKEKTALNAQTENVANTETSQTAEIANNQTQNPENVAIMTFDEKEFDFGEIKEGDKVEHVFSFKNTGKSDLIIEDAKGSCGCTVPDYKKEPIKPGETSTMKVSFDSTGKPGQQQKSVTIKANTATGAELLTIKANVAPKPAGIGVAK